ncbi:MAG: glycoside hydrolase [Candidatus Eremiobacteraeota bacterium]|nr:glycoside hydrolase [Candidatus Eremiobacteraeota bacterium]
MPGIIIGADEPNLIDRAANSPTLAADPADANVILLSARIDRPKFSCVLYRSVDGGAHFIRVSVPLPQNFDTCYAPDVTFDRHGDAYFVFLTLNTHPKDPLSAGNDPNGVWLARSTNGGAKFSTARHILGPDNIQVRIAADPLRDRLYLLWLNGSDLENHTPLGLGPPPNPLKLSVSTDGGATFSAPVQVNDPKRQRVGAASIAVDQSGTAFVLYEDFSNDLDDYNNRALPFTGTFSLILTRSVNHGKSFIESVVDDRIARASRFLIYLPPQPALALSPVKKAVFVAWQDGRDGAPDVLFRSSENSGKTWGNVQRLNERGEEPEAVTLPALSVTTRGRIDSVFLAAHGKGTQLLTNVMYTQSNDNGQTFSKPVAVTSPPFDAYVGPLNPRTQTTDLGTRLALRSAEDRALTAWPDSRLGTPDTGRQDIAFAKIDATIPIAKRPVKRLGGFPEKAPPGTPAQFTPPDPAAACLTASPPRVLFLALEAVPDELQGLRYFVSDWGRNKKCFKGRVVTDSVGIRALNYDILVVDVSPHMTVSHGAVNDIASVVKSRRPVALFMGPASMVTGASAPQAVEAMRKVFPGLIMTRTCANSQLTKMTGGPFDLNEHSFHYESFVHGVYNLDLSARTAPWAHDLCKTGKPTVVRTDRGIIAGFYIAYEVSLADNNTPAITAKRLVVNVIHELAQQ